MRDQHTSAPSLYQPHTIVKSRIRRNGYRHMIFLLLILQLSYNAIRTSSNSPTLAYAFTPSSTDVRRMKTWRTVIQMKPPPQENTQLDRYNDDAFGLVFLTGGLIIQDVDFAGTFLTISAVAASATYVGALKVDVRIPGVVALLTLVLSPVVVSLRSSGTFFGSIVAPLPIQIGLCGVSALVAFFNWKRLT